MTIILDKQSDIYKNIETVLQTVASKYSIDYIEKVSMHVDVNSCFLRFKESVTTERQDEFDNMFSKQDEYYISSDNTVLGYMQLGYNSDYEWDVKTNNITDSYIQSVINSVAQITANGTYKYFLKTLEKKFNSPELKILGLSMSKYYPNSYSQTDIFDAGLDGYEEYEIDGNKKDEHLIEDTLSIPDEIIKQVGPFVVSKDNDQYVVGLIDEQEKSFLVQERFTDMDDVDIYLNNKVNELQDKIYTL